MEGILSKTDWSCSDTKINQERCGTTGARSVGSLRAAQAEALAYGAGGEAMAVGLCQPGAGKAVGHPQQPHACGKGIEKSQALCHDIWWEDDRQLA